MTPIHAAGGVVWRLTSGDALQVCLVHRPRYDDWTLPKGKLEPGEHPIRAAVREVSEEADVYGVPQIRLPRIHYLTRDGLPKMVDFWSMRAVANGGFQPNTEVDEVRWLDLDEAVRLTTYPHDKEVLAAFGDLPRVTAVLGLVRHALAGRRSTWSGPDSARPLDTDGRAQARALAPLLALLRPERLLTASVRRCVQTLDPLADLLDLPIEVDSRLDEPAPGQDGVENALAAAARLTELAQHTPAAVVCSQGKVIPRALAFLAAVPAEPTDGAKPAQPGTVPQPGTVVEPATVAEAEPEAVAVAVADWRTPKGGGWLLAFHSDRLVAADRL